MDMKYEFEAGYKWQAAIKW